MDIEERRPSRRTVTSTDTTGAGIVSRRRGPTTLWDRAPDSYDDGTIDYEQIQDSPSFRELKKRTLKFVVPVTLFFMANYLFFAIMSAYDPELMGQPAMGAINIGMLVGFFQFITTMIIVVSYASYARTNTDPLASDIRRKDDER